METMVKIRVYNIDYEVYRYEYEVENNDFGSEEEYDTYINDLHEDIIVEIDPEDIDWNMEFITEYITDYISDITGETYKGYDYEVLVDINLLRSSG